MSGCPLLCKRSPLASGHTSAFSRNQELPLKGAKRAEHRDVERTEMNWEVYPSGIYEIIREFSSHEGVRKIIVTENGAAFPDTVEDDKVDDPKRREYLISYLEQVFKAKREGCNVSGYFVWSLLDNLEWSKGFDKRFGIVHVDHGTQKRTVKSSALWYRDFLHS